MTGAAHAGSLAPRRVPEAYVRAEVASYPLTGMEAFQAALVELDPDVKGKTGALWQACEHSLVEHASGWSLDRMVGVRDRFWFASRDGDPSVAPVVMHSYLRALSGAHFSPRRGTTELQQSSDETALDAAMHYRWLTLSLPEDMLLAAVEVEPPPQRVDTGSPLVRRRLLDRGVAELHQHVGAGMSFPMLWASALAALTDPGLGPGALASVGAPFDDGAGLTPWLLAAALARTVLAELLIRRELDGAGDLAAFLGGLSSRAVWSTGRRRVLEQALDALCQPRARALPDYPALQQLYRDVHPSGCAVVEERPQTIDEMWRRADPIAVRLGLDTPEAGERWLMRRALAYLEQEGATDRVFAKVFWQVLRVRCQYYRTVAQRPLTAGLQWFLRFYSRIKAFRDPLREIRSEAAWAVAGEGNPIAALEIRTSPEDTAVKLGEELLTFITSWEHVLQRTGGVSGGPQEPEIGVVLHFVKERSPRSGDGWSSGHPAAFWRGTHAEPGRAGGRRNTSRYAEYYAAQAVRARATAELLRAVPSVLWLLRGLDVASDELSIPSWIMVPLQRFVHQEAAFATARRASEGAPALRTTAHVGEDFRHLMEGLRRVHEGVQYLLGSAGERLGHATALGVEPRIWAESVGSVLMPEEERLWDLVFDWRLASGHRVQPEFFSAPPPERLARLENLIRPLAMKVFDTDHAPRDLAEAHHLLHRFLMPPIGPALTEARLGSLDHALDAVRWERVRAPDRVRAILQAYLHDDAVFRRGQHLADITLDESEINALYAAQDALRRGVAARGIVVEVNPSSNLLIGDMLDLRHHPILRLFPPEPREGPPSIPIAVGSDDPVTFTTSLLREYTLLHQTARAAGYSESSTQAWLEAIRQTAMDARFTLSWHPSAAGRAARLRGALERFLQRSSRSS